MFLVYTIISFIISFSVTFYLIPRIWAMAYNRGVVDIPDGKIKCHEKATPYLGGIGVYSGFLVSLSLVLPFDNRVGSLLIGSTILLLVGLLDDLIALSPLQKLVGQIVAVMSFLKGGFHLKEVFSNDYWFFVGVPISFLWMLSVINSFNLVDIMDGLATTIAIGAALSFFVIACLWNLYTVAIILASFLGALVAFLWYNKPTARIYLGDAGSLFIGGFLSAIPFLFKWSKNVDYGYFVPSILLAIPLLEVTLLIIIRTHKKIPFYHASPDHFALYLRRRHWSIPSILQGVLVASFYLLFVSLLFLYEFIGLFFLFVMSLIFLCVWYFTIYYAAN